MAAYDSLASAASRGEDEVTAASTDDLVVHETAVDPVVDTPPLETSTGAIGVVDIMGWMPAPALDEHSSHGEDVAAHMGPVSTAADSAVDEVATSPEAGDAATTQSGDSGGYATADADMLTQEATGVADTQPAVPTLATPAFGELTVAGAGNISAPASGEGLGPISAPRVDTEPGDVWKWGEPSTTEVTGNTIAAADGSESIHESDAPHAVTGGAPSMPVEPWRRGETSSEEARSLEEMKEREPWTMSPAKSYAPGDAIGDALERVAKRIREGKIILPVDTTADTDEAALALALAALLRVRPD
ncbi:MAG: hypothetical protein ACR2G6_00245 [Gemmatimonadaceae bacterium]